MRQETILETERLLLRPWKDCDAGALYELAKDPEVGPRAGWPVHESEENSREIIRTVLSEPETYAILRKEDGALIGSAGLKDLQQESYLDSESSAELGYWIGRAFWGKGSMPEAAGRLRGTSSHAGFRRSWDLCRIMSRRMRRYLFLVKGDGNTGRVFSGRCICRTRQEEGTGCITSKPATGSAARERMALSLLKLNFRS